MTAGKRSTTQKKAGRPKPGEGTGAPMTLNMILRSLRDGSVTDYGYQMFIRPILKKEIEIIVGKFNNGEGGESVLKTIKKCPPLLKYAVQYEYKYPEFMRLYKCFIALLQKGGLKYNYDVNINNINIIEWYNDRLKCYYSLGFDDHEVDSLTFYDYRNLPDQHFRSPTENRDYDESYSQVKKRARKKLDIEALIQHRSQYIHHNFEGWLSDLVGYRNGLYDSDNEKYAHLEGSVGVEELSERMRAWYQGMTPDGVKNHMRPKAIERIKEIVCSYLSNVDVFQIRAVSDRRKSIIRKKVAKEYSYVIFSRYIPFDEIWEQGYEEGKLQYAHSIFR